MISRSTAMATMISAPHATMKASVRDIYGSPDVVQLREVPKPNFGDDEVLVRVRAAGLDRGAWHMMAGRPYLMRIAGFGLRAPKNPVLGKDVTTLRAGDEVFGVGAGSFAEYAVARADQLAPKPANLTFEQAAAVGVSGSTALLAVRDQGHVKAAQDVLIIGASGGVGTFAVQIAKAFGARVTGVCSASK